MELIEVRRSNARVAHVRHFGATLSLLLLKSACLIQVMSMPTLVPRALHFVKPPEMFYIRRVVKASAIPKFAMEGQSKALFPLKMNIVTLESFCAPMGDLPQKERFLSSLNLGGNIAPGEHYYYEELLEDFYKWASPSVFPTPRRKVEKFMASGKTPKVTLDAFKYHFFPTPEPEILPHGKDFHAWLQHQYPKEDYGVIESKNFYDLKQLYQNYIRYMTQTIPKNDNHYRIFADKLTRTYWKMWLSADDGTQLRRVSLDTYRKFLENEKPLFETPDHIREAARNFLAEDLDDGWHLRGERLTWMEAQSEQLTPTKDPLPRNQYTIELEKLSKDLDPETRQDFRNFVFLKTYRREPLVEERRPQELSELIREWRATRRSSQTGNVIHIWTYRLWKLVRSRFYRLGKWKVFKHLKNLSSKTLRK